MNEDKVLSFTLTKKQAVNIVRRFNAEVLKKYQIPLKYADELVHDIIPDMAETELENGEFFEIRLNAFMTPDCRKRSIRIYDTEVSIKWENIE